MTGLRSVAKIAKVAAWVTWVAWVAATAIAPLANAADTPAQRWEQSPHGELLKRTLPPSLTPTQLPEPSSRGAKLTAQFCVQCHYLVNPAMHDAAKWPKIVARMVPRMRGQGNRGPLMLEMMQLPNGSIAAPTDGELRAITAYLQKYGQTPANTRQLTGLDRNGGLAFARACSQCHALPDPARYTRTQWPTVVARMQRNMAWMNRIEGSRPDDGRAQKADHLQEPQLQVDEIVAYLQARAKP